MRKLLFFCFCATICCSTFFTACNKLSNSTFVPVSDSVIIRSNVFVVDSLKYKLISTASELDLGTYIFSFSGNVADLRHNGDFNPGAVMIGTANQGYMRKIVSVNDEADKFTVYTEPAKLEDIIQQGNFSFSTHMIAGGGQILSDDLTQYYSVPNKALYNNNGVAINLTNGTYTNNSNWNYHFQFTNGKLSAYTNECVGGTSNTGATVSIIAANDDRVAFRDSILVTSNVRQIRVGNVPLTISCETYFCYSGAGNVTANTQLAINSSTADTFDIDNNYLNGNWTNSAHFNTSNNIHATNTGNLGANHLEIKTGMQSVVRICGMPTAVVGLPISLNINSNTNGVDKDLNITGNLTAELNEKAYVYGYAPLEYSKNFNAPFCSYVTPYQLSKVSGDNQSGPVSQYLPQPLVVQVKDNKGSAASGIRVRFRVTSGGGSVSITNATTDASGIAQTNWLKGGSDIQRVEATVVTASGAAIIGSPATFSAN